MINPDEEAFNNNMFVTNQPVAKRPHPLTTTNKQMMIKGGGGVGGGLMIPTTPTTIHNDIIARER
jgi:hypothetical protein